MQRACAVVSNTSLVGDGGGVHTTDSMDCPIKAALTVKPKLARIGCSHWVSNFVRSDYFG